MNAYFYEFIVIENYLMTILNPMTMHLRRKSSVRPTDKYI